MQQSSRTGLGLLILLFWNPRQYHSVAVFDGLIWVMEEWHQDSGNRNDVWYSAYGVNWYEVPDTPWAKRHASTVFVYKNALWMAAGNSMDRAEWKLPAAAGTGGNSE